MYSFDNDELLKIFIATLLILHRSTNIKQDLRFCKNVIYIERKRLWVSFLLK